jgi:DNA repair exonuclease SbcCD ATPase subunit
MTDYRDLVNRDLAEQRRREGEELEEQAREFERAKRQRQREERREQHAAVDELRAEIDALRRDYDRRYEVQMEAIGQVIGETADHVADAIKKIQNELFGLVERRFGELIGRIEALTPGERSRNFKFANEPEDVVDLPNPLPPRRRVLDS